MPIYVLYLFDDWMSPCLQQSDCSLSAHFLHLSLSLSAERAPIVTRALSRICPPDLLPSRTARRTQTGRQKDPNRRPCRRLRLDVRIAREDGCLLLLLLLQCRANRQCCISEKEDATTSSRRLATVQTQC